MENNQSVKIKQNIDKFIEDLLHIEDVTKNKLLDIYAGDASKTYLVSYDELTSMPSSYTLSQYILSVILKRIGKPGNTVMRKSSALTSEEQIIGKEINAIDWISASGERDPKALRNFIDSAYKEISLKGNNPLFLSVGALKWKIAKADEVFSVTTPLLIFPIRLVRSENANTPVYVEFINDDVYINPCLIAKLKQVLGDEMSDKFPHPDGEFVNPSTAVDLDKLFDGQTYFNKVEDYIKSSSRFDLGEETLFKFDRNIVAIFQYNHDELCMYYDIQGNKENIYKHPLIQRVFNKCEPLPDVECTKPAKFVLQRDSVQEEIIKQVVNGQSLVVKGPPGTGKTQTITNMIASLLAAGKRILLSSTKVAAMSEVYMKLPEELRKFVMLLDCETEAQAAKLNPVEIKKDFADLLRQAKNYTTSNSVYDEYGQAQQGKKIATSFLGSYQKDVFETRDIIGKSYYEALDLLCNDIETVHFIKPQIAAILTTDQYLRALNKVKEASGYIDKICNGHDFFKSPWVSQDKNIQDLNAEAIVKANAEINAIIEQLNAELNRIETVWGVSFGEIDLSTLTQLSESAFLLDDVRRALDKTNEILLENLCIALDACILKEDADTKTVVVTNTENIEELDKVLADAKIDLSLRKSEFVNFANSANVRDIMKNDRRTQTTLNLIKEVTDNISAYSAKLDEFHKVFTREITQEQINVVSESYDVFKDYIEQNLEGPKFFDGKAKKAYKALCALGYGKEIAFKDVISAVAIYKDYEKLLEKEKEIYGRISSLLNFTFTEETLQDFLELYTRALESDFDSVPEFIQAFEEDQEAFEIAFTLVNSDKDYTLKQLVDAFSFETSKIKLIDALSRYDETVDKNAIDLKGALSKAKTARAIKKAYESCVFGRDAETLSAKATQFYKNSAGLGRVLADLYKALKSFKKNFFSNYYNNVLALPTVNDLKIFTKESCDRNIINAVVKYSEIVYNRYNELPLANFFRPFENARMTTNKYSYAEIFEHSIYDLAVKYKLERAGLDRNGVGERVEKEQVRFAQSESDFAKATLKMVEAQCITSIKPDAPEYQFLNAERTSGETLRRMFKLHAKAVKNLKQCFILSPSTASVLFGSEEFSDFDVAIIDEASQLEPTAILPIMVRAKQVVLVGDEWQMPPIKHFTTRTVKRLMDEDGQLQMLDPNTSVLGLSLANCAFPTTQLVCHYRSKTESLITYSQHKHYPFMRTFPASLPKADGLGFKYIYTPDGFSDGAANDAEAKKVIEELNLHFDKYYDERTGKLSESVGVVAFGEKQLNYIISLKNKDKALCEKIKTAIANFDDLEERLIFFKTIETVQGQEIDHLIISLTYGRNKSGAVSGAFGELNRGGDGGRLGECIFNVAVTRAKSSVTVITSVEEADISNANVAFIGQYLGIAKKFSQDGKSQFVGKSIAENVGFIKDVAKYLVSLGINENRIVIDYGATDGSVRIPIAILSTDLSSVKFAVWCEKPLGKEYDYFDYNVRYVQSLKSRDWEIVKVYIHDWFDNKAIEQQKLKDAVAKYC